MKRTLAILMVSMVVLGLLVSGISCTEKIPDVDIIGTENAGKGMISILYHYTLDILLSCNREIEESDTSQSGSPRIILLRMLATPLRPQAANHDSNRIPQVH